MSDNRKELRKSKIQARNSLSPEERERLSAVISERIAASEVFQRAKTVLIYRATKGEVRLDALEKADEAAGKRLVYPLCISDSEMISLLPEDENAWKTGYFGIMEPVREKSAEIPPEEIDLVICPCTVFDENCGRMGMGAGFYDRYLAKCVNAHIAAVAFEVQKADSIPMEPWDKPMEMVFTEAGTYYKKHD
ncbi:MAG: 5-formyltetrahydrofolate cyclo-ligase [Firmicutes bacterium]|nr:5-formyltetrahydrofolate cyclo-ligase [Bacillota bacterium]